MSLSEYADSKTYFELFDEIDHRGFFQNPIKARFFALKVLFEELLHLPFGVGYKLYKTFFRGFGLFLSGIFVFSTFGSSCSLREYFLKKMSCFARDLGDWVLYPLAVVGTFFRLILSIVFSPKFFFRF